MDHHAQPSTRFQARKFDKILSLIEQAHTFTAFEAAWRNSLQLYGLKHGVHLIDRHSYLDKANQLVLSTYPAEWITYYLERDYLAIDPAVTVCANSLIPIAWADLDKSAPAVERLFAESIEAGVGRHGMTIPVHGLHGQRALFLVTSDESDEDWHKHLKTRMLELQALSFHFQTRFMHLKHYDPATAAMHGRGRDKTLSGRESECLCWAASGKTIEETSTILKVSGSAVRSYLDSARHKLNCMTKTQAVARALQLGLISLPG